MEKQLQLKKIGCSNCGAELIFDPGTQMTNCNFCGSQFQIENAQDEEIVTPDGILPFKVSKEIYENSVLSWLSEGDYTPDDILHTTIFDSVNGVYLPMWFFKGRYNGNWSASSGYDRWEEYLDRDSSGKLQRKTRRVTDWRPSSGQIGGEFAILGFAGQGKGIKGSIATYAHNTSFERGDIKPYDPKYTLGFNLIDFTKDDIDTWEAIGKPQANALATADGKNRVPGDRHKDFYCDVLYTQEKSLRLYLPFWITTYTYEEKEFFVYMDGTTATRIEGVRPVDEARKKEVNKKFIPGHIALVLFVISVFIVTNQDNYDAKENWEAITKFIALVMLILYCVGFYQKNKIIKTSKEKRQRILDAVKNGQSIDDVLKDYDQPQAIESSSIGKKKIK